MFWFFRSCQQSCEELKAAAWAGDACRQQRGQREFYSWWRWRRSAANQLQLHSISQTKSSTPFTLSFVNFSVYIYICIDKQLSHEQCCSCTLCVSTRGQCKTESGQQQNIFTLVSGLNHLSHSAHWWLFLLLEERINQSKLCMRG